MTAQPPSLALRLFRRFPTTTLVMAPYVLLYLPLAIWNDNPGTDFIIYTGGLAVGAAFLVEFSFALVVLSERRSRRAPGAPATTSTTSIWHGDRVGVVARAVSVVSIVTNLAFVTLGGTTLTSQVAGVVPSGVLTLLSPFVSWGWVALALLFSAHALGGIDRWTLVRWLVALVATQAAVAYVTNITARTLVFLVTLAAVALLTRLLPRSWILGGVAAVAVVWPTVYQIRNTLRQANGIAVAEDVSATDRLRFDEQIVKAEQYGPGHDLGQPDLFSALRYGLVPRFLDPGRPAVSSGNLVNEFLGGASFSSWTFMSVATSWFFWGTIVVVLIYAVHAVVILGLRPWNDIARRPAALIILTLIIGGPLSWVATPPDVFIMFLQTTVSAIPVFLVLRLWARSSREPRTARVGKLLRDAPRPVPQGSA